MADKILVWHSPDTISTDGRIGPTYYIEQDYVPVACRIHAVTAPSDGDCAVAIYDDGASIFKNRASRHVSLTGIITWDSEAKTGVLPKGSNSEDLADNFDGSKIAAGSWVHCTVPEGKGAKNITVILELEKTV